MTGSDAATVTSQGQEIIWTEDVGFRYQAGVPRLINGSEALNFGATATGGSPTEYEFGSASACRTWWDNYHIEMEKNGGGFVSLGDPVQGSAQTKYLNVTGSVPPDNGVEWVAGDVIKFRISSAT